MHELIMGKSVHCDLNGEKTYDRFVGGCFLDNKDIGISIIEAGLATQAANHRTSNITAFSSAIGDKPNIKSIRHHTTRPFFFTFRFASFVTMSIVLSRNIRTLALIRSCTQTDLSINDAKTYPVFL